MKLNVIALEDADLKLSELIALAKTRPIVVTRKGRPVIEITDVAGFDLECLALSDDPKFLKIIEDSRRSYDRDGGVSLEQVCKEHGLEMPKPKRRRGPVAAVAGKGKR